MSKLIELYYRALRRVEKGTAPNVEEAFKYLHPGSRNVPALEYMLHRMVSILAQEFLQWEITSSLPCKLLLSILAKRLLIVIETVSSPIWLFQSLLNLLQPIPNQVAKIQSKQEENVSNVKVYAHYLIIFNLFTINYYELMKWLF